MERLVCLRFQIQACSDGLFAFCVCVGPAEGNHTDIFWFGSPMGIARRKVLLLRGGVSPISFIRPSKLRGSSVPKDRNLKGQPVCRAPSQWGLCRFFVGPFFGGFKRTQKETWQGGFGVQILKTRRATRSALTPRECSVPCGSRQSACCDSSKTVLTTVSGDLEASRTILLVA